MTNQNEVNEFRLNHRYVDDLERQTKEEELEYTCLDYYHYLIDIFYDTSD